MQFHFFGAVSKNAQNAAKGIQMLPQNKLYPLSNQLSFNIIDPLDSLPQPLFPEPFSHFLVKL